MMTVVQVLMLFSLCDENNDENDDEEGGSANQEPEPETSHKDVRAMVVRPIVSIIVTPSSG